MIAWYCVTLNRTELVINDSPSCKANDPIFIIASDFSFKMSDCPVGINSVSYILWKSIPSVSGWKKARFHFISMIYISMIHIPGNRLSMCLTPAVMNIAQKQVQDWKLFGRDGKYSMYNIQIDEERMLSHWFIAWCFNSYSTVKTEASPEPDRYFWLTEVKHFYLTDWFLKINYLQFYT